MAISAAQVKELRQRTGCGMMECKKALTEASGDMDAAAKALRKSGLAKADKKAGRVASEGLVAVEVSGDGKSAVIVEINSETDFVAKKEEFQSFVHAVAKCALEAAPADLDALMALPVSSGESVEEARRGLIAAIGENINVRRFVRREAGAGSLSSYKHGDRIGVLVELDGGDADLARDVAMHVAASRPVCVDESGVSQDVLDKEKEIFSAQAAASGKPPEIIEKMVSGRIRKFLGEITLVGQPFVKDPDQTVGKLLKTAGATIVGFDRLELGEGIEKKTENFAEEVMAQVQGS
ncbi:Translation elongation factor Ts [hydrothermal vent metagenome]|uniref:Translation elongation factor Ts n=1 Tax=hydrothermal vent metagenome TaxID=652676 RepID=A0A3B0YKM8_9ZZZZ